MPPLTALFLVAFTAPAFAAQPCDPANLPKIIGLDYHTARAKLIKAGCIPIPYNIKDEGGRPAPTDSMRLGYVESSHASSGQGVRWFTWPQFTVYSSTCGDLLDTETRHTCRVKSIEKPDH